MFGIGLPELILIMAVALIVVGPEKLPDLARGLAKQFFELKKAANSLKDSLQEEENAVGKSLDVQASTGGFSRPEQLAAEALKAQGTKILEPGSPREDRLEQAVAGTTEIEQVAAPVVVQPPEAAVEPAGMAVAVGSLAPDTTPPPSDKTDV